MSRPVRDERGAVAIMFGLLSVLLLIIAAFAVDLGNAYAHKRERQKDTDLATLAGVGVGGENLPAPGTSGTCSYGNKAAATDQAVIDVALYLSKQLAPQTITPQQLVDCDVSGNGEAFYGKPTLTNSGWSLAYNENQLSVVSPPDNVDFGFADVIGVDDVDVAGVSTAEIRSPKLGVMPFYAAPGCDYGPQTISQPNNGQAAGAVLLDSPSQTNAATLDSITPTMYAHEITPDATLRPLEIDGTFPTDPIQAIGFFEPGNAVAGPAPVEVTDATKWTMNAARTKLTLLDLPDAVSTVQTYWYVRVKINGQWSAVNYGNAVNPRWTPLLTIGDPPLKCDQGSSAGNFGTLKFQTTGQWQVTAQNIAVGLPKNLVPYPPANRTADGLCTTVGNPPAVKWNGILDNVNCVETETGMAQNAATAGFVTGHSSFDGRLAITSATATANTGCAADGEPARSSSTFLGEIVNNDTLSCFLTNDITTLAQVATPTYTLAAPVFSADIYNSPRFGYVPALGTIPATGGSQAYQIWDFRPVFVTNQTLTATRTTPVNGDHNGLIPTSNNQDLQSVQVIMLNQRALPNPPASAGSSVFTGTGLKLPLLVN